MTIKTETLDASIGRRVATARQAGGYTTIQAAKRLSLEEADYRAREAGIARFRSRDLSILAKFFSIEVRSLFGDSDPAVDGTVATGGFALADWVEASRRREGLSAVLQSNRDAVLDALPAEAA